MIEIGIWWYSIYYFKMLLEGLNIYANASEVVPFACDQVTKIVQMWLEKP